MIVELSQDNDLFLFVATEANRWDIEGIRGISEHFEDQDVFPNVQFILRNDNTGQLHRFFGYIVNLADDATDREYDHTYLTSRAGQRFADWMNTALQGDLKGGTHGAVQYFLLDVELTTREIPTANGDCEGEYLLVQPGVYLGNVNWDEPITDEELLRVEWDNGDTQYFPIVLQYPKEHPLQADETLQYGVLCDGLCEEGYALENLHHAIEELIDDGVLEQQEGVIFDVSILPMGGVPQFEDAID